MEKNEKLRGSAPTPDILKRLARTTLAYAWDSTNFAAEIGTKQGFTPLYYLREYQQTGSTHIWRSARFARYPKVSIDKDQCEQLESMQDHYSLILAERIQRSSTGDWSVRRFEWDDSIGVLDASHQIRHLSDRESEQSLDQYTVTSGDVMRLIGNFRRLRRDPSLGYGISIEDIAA